MEDWPIYRLSKDRAEFIREIDEFTFNRIANRHRKDLADVLVKTIYQERIRIKESPWKVDPPNERQFWNRISKRLIKKSLDRNDAEAKAAAEDILQKIIHRYSEEIVGTFQVGTFKFAQRFLTAFFNRLFNAAVGKSIRSIFRGRRHLYERLNVVGDVETVRALFQHGTVVVVPTHSSNLDSILVGYAMDQIMGLPSFSYGAGLNLYNFGPAAYFMNRLGAYRVDRRKKNSIYLETLKAMSNLSIQRGVNSLFFPGGTRSRSGALEADLKMGLLGTAVEAQRAMCQGLGIASPAASLWRPKGDLGSEKDALSPSTVHRPPSTGKKVFIVPMVLCYNFVLEAPFLIEQHLRSTGKENYLRLKDEGTSVRAWLRFIWRFFSTTSDITLSVGRPMDVLGNFVDAEGRSFDRFGNGLDVSEYFMGRKNEINEDRQREEEYTKLLAERIVERYHVENIVLSSHLVAYAVFEMLLHENPKLDLFGILRLPPDDYVFPFRAVEEVVEQMQEKLVEWKEQGKIRLAPEIHRAAADVVRDGVKNLGVFHTEKPLGFTRDGDIVSSNFRVLYFYHNRLENYQLDKYVHWKAEEIEVLKVD
ncbi:MAG: glycerol acyltransferase [Haliscomenobacteraceae bacterium CHB4]|nr:Glycerol-3-phosphate acyltransferase [Saprospiraceae bacterium]MCE7924648.1 glycerol acyltransferase [Haliscomenobacteraceae bacterium CHB4]